MDSTPYIFFHARFLPQGKDPQDVNFNLENIIAIITKSVSELRNYRNVIELIPFYFVFETRLNCQTNGGKKSILHLSFIGTKTIFLT